MLAQQLEGSQRFSITLHFGESHPEEVQHVPPNEPALTPDAAFLGPLVSPFEEGASLRQHLLVLSCVKHLEKVASLCCLAYFSINKTAP